VTALPGPETRRETGAPARHVAVHTEQRWARHVSRSVGLLGAVAVTVLLVVSGLRVAYPFPLEWQEGTMLEHARRMAAGLPVYIEPGLDFAPFPYPPLYHALGALALSATGGGGATAAAPLTPDTLGSGLTALRAVSLAATLALLALVAYEGARAARGSIPNSAASRRWPSALLGAGLVAAGAGFGGWFLDLARVDALALVLIVGATFAARRAHSQPAIVLAALVACLAVLAKQTAALPCAALIAPIAARSLRLGTVYVGTFGLSLAVVAVVGDDLSGGFATFTVIDVLAGSPWHEPAILGFLWEALLAYTPLVALFFVAGRGTRRAALREPFVLASALGLVAAAWLGRAHAGGYDNTLLPLVVAAALVAPRLVDGRARTGALAGLALVWLAAIGGDPREVVPTSVDRAATEHTVNALAALPAPAFVPDAPELAELAGHPRVMHAMALIDLLQSRQHAAATRLVERLEVALEQRVYGAVVLDEPWDLPALHEHYVQRGKLAVTAPRTGAPRAPRVMFLPR
jgi:hypothetical protein